MDGIVGLKRLIAQASSLANDHPCISSGHQWESDGGRSCPKDGFGKGDGCSQTVYTCARCGIHDYGYEGGPAHRECFVECHYEPMEPEPIKHKAPWLDFSGNEIHEGDVLVHPSGERGVVCFYPDEKLVEDQWRVFYAEHGGSHSRLCLQIGDKGQASISVLDANRGNDMTAPIAQGPVEVNGRPEFNPARILGYPDFNGDGHALAAGPFKCPECGGWTFSSSIGNTGKGEKGYCNDAFDVGCRFQWERSDDRKYFAGSPVDGPVA